MSRLSTFLKRERDRRGWSKTDLAEHSGVPMPTLSRYENPRSNAKPSHANILLLATAFDMPPGDILRYIGYPPQKYINGEARDKKWDEIRALLESDPRAQRLLELYGAADEEQKDDGVAMLEIALKPRRHRPRRPPQEEPGT